MGQTCSKQSFIEEQQKNEESIQAAIRYENGRFKLPSKIQFQSQKTLRDIQKAAFKFCQEHNINFDYMPCITRIIAYKQDKAFLTAFNKTPQAEKDNLLEQLHRIPQDQIDLFYHNFIKKIKLKHSTIGNINDYHRKKIEMPQHINVESLLSEQKQRISKIGQEIVNSGKVAIVVMCSGSSSRFDGQPKFISPLKLSENPNLTILDFLFLRLNNMVKNKSSLLIIVSYNESNYKEIQNFFRDRKYFGFERMNFRYVETQSLPILDLNGKYCLDQKYKIIKRPFGTSRVVIELLKYQTYDFLKEHNVKYLHFIGAQNLLQHPCDPFMIGAMQVYNKILSAKCVDVNGQWEKLPRYISQNKKITFKLWNQLKQQYVLPTVHEFPIATNSVVIELQYLKDSIKDYHTDTHASENYHIIRKIQKIMDIHKDKLYEAQCITFEGDIRDLIACSSDPLLIKDNRNTSYAPIMSKYSEYSLYDNVEYFKNILNLQYKNSPSSFLQYFK